MKIITLLETIKTIHEIDWLMYKNHYMMCHIFISVCSQKYHLCRWFAVRNTVPPACKVSVLSKENWPYKRADLTSGHPFYCDIMGCQLIFSQRQSILPIIMASIAIKLWLSPLNYDLYGFKQECRMHLEIFAQLPPNNAIFLIKFGPNAAKLTIQAGISDLEAGFFTNKMSISFGTSQKLTI